MSHHESFQATSEEKAGSNRSFGLVFATAFAAVGLWPVMAGAAPRPWALAAAAVFGALALAAPGLLQPLNRAWTAVGRLLHKIVSPVVMGVLYIAAVVPTGLILRLSGKDPLRLKRAPAARSYWIARTPPGPAAGSFTNQF